MESKNLIYSHIIKGKASLEQCLFSNEYKNLISAGNRLTNITYCHIRNISQISYIKSKVTSSLLSFDLLFIYEYENLKSNVKEYGLYKEKISKSIDIPLDSYEKFAPSLNLSSINCKCILKNIRYLTDIDIESKSALISVNATLEGLLIEDGTVQFMDVPKFNSELIIDNPKVINLPAVSYDIENNSALSPELRSLIKKAESISKSQKALEDLIETKSKRISYLELKIKNLEEKYNKASHALEEKSNEVSILSNEKVDTSKFEREISVLKDENIMLSEKLKEYEEKKKIEEAYEKTKHKKNIKKKGLFW